MTNKILRNLVLCFGISTLLLVLPTLQSSFAHQISLYFINGKDYLMEVEWANEPVAVDDKTNIVLTVVSPNMTDPTNAEANGTQPITGLENSLKVDIMAGNKTLSSNLDPAFGELGVYESETFYPTIPTTFSFRVYGDMNGTSFDNTVSCNPILGEDVPPDNSTVKISNGVERMALIGGLECPDDRIGFPEPYTSQHEIVQALNGTDT
ncbi:hypothetical protein [Candidatus Nitrosocosmicus sp. R]